MPYAEEWLFEVVMPPFLVADGVVVYQLESQYYLPVRQMAEGLEFFVEPSPKDNYISGWYIEENNSFVIDAERGELIVKGERRPLPEGAVLNSDAYQLDDVYVRLELLNEIWPTNLQVDLQKLSILVTASDDLAFQDRLARQKRREKLLTRQEEATSKDSVEYIPVENTYRLLGKPVVDVQSTYSYDETDKSLTGSNTLSGTTQLMGTVANFSATFPYQNNEKFQRPDNVRLQFNRRAIGEQSMLLGMRSIQAGDVNLRHRELVDASTAGRGVVVSSEDSARGGEFDRITIEGIGPPEWEIELYNNNELIAFGAVAADGQYLFEDVALRFGNNRIRIVFYGPQGQVREEVENYNVGGIMQSPGKSTYELGLVDADRDFILLDNEPRTQPRGTAANIFASYGLLNNLTIFGSATTLPTDFDIRDYYTVGGAFSALGGTGSVEFYKENGGGEAVDVRFITALAGVKLNLRNSFFNDFSSPDAGFDQNGKEFEGQYEANKIFGLSFGVLGLNLNVKHQKNKDDTTASDINFQQTFSRGGVRLSHTTSTDLLDREHQRTSGQANATVRLNKWQFRGAGSYEAFPERELTTGQLEARYRTDYGLQGAVNMRHNFIQSETSYGGQIGYDFGSVLASFDTEYEQEEGFQFVLRASTSIHPYTEDGSYTLSSRTKKSVSPYKALVFLDHDGDGLFSEHDEPLAGAHTRANGGRSAEETNEDGVLVHELSGAGRETVIKLDQYTLDDPFLKPAIPGYITNTIIGTMPEMFFPVIMTGSMDGTVRYEDGHPAAGIDMELVDQSGAVVAKSRTAFDGLYTFEFIEPGQYKVRSNSKYKVYVPPYPVTVSLDDPFLFGVDLVAMKQAQEEQSAVQDGEKSEGVVAHTHPTQPIERTYEPASFHQKEEDAMK